MWRNMRTGLLVAATVVLVCASFPVRGDDSTAMSDKVEVPSFQVEVMVSPAMGLMKIPPANPPSFSETPRLISQYDGYFSLFLGPY